MYLCHCISVMLRSIASLLKLVELHWQNEKKISHALFYMRACFDYVMQ